MSDTLTIRLEHRSKANFDAHSGSGHVVSVDGSPKIGGENLGMRPMEMLLCALASCSAMDVVAILGKQGEPLEGLTVQAEGKRADAVPAVFTDIHLVFTASDAVHAGKFERAVRLSVEKYCSVRMSLSPEVRVTWEARPTKA